jgi:hypothetical protein
MEYHTDLFFNKGNTAYLNGAIDGCNRNTVRISVHQLLSVTHVRAHMVREMKRMANVQMQMSTFSNHFFVIRIGEKCEYQSIQAHRRLHHMWPIWPIYASIIHITFSQLTILYSVAYQ